MQVKVFFGECNAFSSQWTVIRCCLKICRPRKIFLQKQQVWGSLGPKLSLPSFTNFSISSPKCMVSEERNSKSSNVSENLIEKFRKWGYFHQSTFSTHKHAFGAGWASLCISSFFLWKFNKCRFNPLRLDKIFRQKQQVWDTFVFNPSFPSRARVSNAASVLFLKFFRFRNTFREEMLVLCFRTLSSAIVCNSSGSNLTIDSKESEALLFSLNGFIGLQLIFSAFNRSRRSTGSEILKQSLWKNLILKMSHYQLTCLHSISSFRQLKMAWILLVLFLSQNPTRFPPSVPWNQRYFLSWLVEKMRLLRRC